ncbi:MAG: SDR family oxidoreductase [Deltaproteobacteria bacterium]
MQILLTGRNALVGGSTSGIGKAIALKFAQCGANVTLMSRDESKLQKTLYELDNSKGQKHSYIVADFSTFGIFKSIISEYFKVNTVDILVNNTQGPEAGDVLEKSNSDYQNAFDLLFQTVSFTTLEAVKGMKKKKYGRVINVSSLTVKEPKSHLVLSNTIRTALISWSKSLSVEIAADNITVNSILTGYFDTERLNSLMKSQAIQKNVSFESMKENLIRTVPMKRFGKPEEYAYLATFLASDYASYITGANIPIDGGLLKSI